MGGAIGGNSGVSAAQLATVRRSAASAPPAEGSPPPERSPSPQSTGSYATGRASDLDLNSLNSSPVAAPGLPDDFLAPRATGPSGSVKIGPSTYEVRQGQVSLDGQPIGTVDDAGAYDVTIAGQRYTGLVSELAGAVVRATTSDGAAVINGPSGSVRMGERTFDVHDGQVSLDGRSIGTLNDRGEYDVTLDGQQVTGRIADLQAAGAIADLRPASLGDSRISNGVVSIGTSTVMAGAIDSMVVNGREYINAYDHGRELQMAYNYDLRGEALNPTEAGSSSDGRGPTSTSRLLSLNTGAGVLESAVNPAYWLRPGERTFLTNGLVGTDGTAVNTTLVSNDVLRKRVELNAGGDPNVVKFTTTLSSAEPHHFMAMEAPTGYLAGDFTATYQFDPGTGRADEFPLTASAGTSRAESTSAKPLIMATPDGQHAMGVFVPPDPRFKGYVAMTYRGHDAEDSTNKWSLAFAEGDPTLQRLDVPAGDHEFQSFMVVGDLETVKRSMAELARQYPDPTSSRVFDWRHYLQQNPDLAGSGIRTQAQAEAHWLAFGIQEGRQGSANFNARDYLRAHPELPTAGSTSNWEAVMHFLRASA